MLSNQKTTESIRQYILITANYWTFTLTDGALRMLVVLHFHQLGYSPLAIASLFLFYEFFGIVTNLIGGWIGSIIGLNKTMNIGLAIQIVALSMLAAPDEWLSIAWVMLAQAFSGIAKDLNKMSAKSAIKFLLGDTQPESKLYRWVALLTGSKNTLKGIGFFLGAALLEYFGFQLASSIMAAMLVIMLSISLFKLEQNIGKAKVKSKFSQLFSKSRAINCLSAARFFLFGARDIWFVVALPVYLSNVLLWSHWQVGSFMASWVIGYGIIQAYAPKITRTANYQKSNFNWSLILIIVTALMALLLQFSNISQQLILIVGLSIFAMVFAVNSALHSFLIIYHSSEQSVSVDVGFYYMANAAGRLVGTLLSGWIYQTAGLVSCLIASTVFIAVACLLNKRIPNKVSGLSDKV